MAPAAAIIEGIFDGTKAREPDACAAASALVAISIIPGCEVLAAGAPAIATAAKPNGVTALVLSVPVVHSATVANSTLPLTVVLASGVPKYDSGLDIGLALLLKILMS
jgi:hypothetical protein